MHIETGSEIEQPMPDITPPYTAERKRSDDTESSDPTSIEFTTTPVTDILKDISNSILGIGHVRSSSAAPPKEKQEKKLQSFTSRLTTNTFFSQNRGKSDESNYTFESSGIRRLSNWFVPCKSYFGRLWLLRRWWFFTNDSQKWYCYL